VSKQGQVKETLSEEPFVSLHSIKSRRTVLDLYMTFMYLIFVVIVTVRVLSSIVHHYSGMNCPMN
jgi:hypothetical protein